MLVVPQYDVAHDLGGEQQTIRDATGNNAECLSRILTRSGYQVDTILGGGQAEKSTLADSGFAAVERMTTLLRANAYGVFYFLGHGAYTDDHADPDVELPMLWMGSTNWNDPDLGAWMRSLIKKVRAGGVSIYSPRMAREHVAQKLTERLKLKWDSKNPPLWVYVDTDSKPVVAVYPNYFAQLRAAGTDFSGSLLWLNGCNTGKTDRFLRESGAASFVGWQQPMAGQWIAQAAATVFDLLADKARTLRGALEIWRLHEAWKWRTAGVATVPENQDDANMLAIGGDGQPFNVIAISPQTHILIFHIRHSPASASSDIAKSVARVENCWTDVWEPGLGALAAPLCNALTFAGHQPVRDEIDDALFEVGAAESSPVAGSAVRWTLAD